jgi:hypothetical protein
VAELLAHAALEDPHRDEPDHLARLVPDRNLAAHRPAERAGLDADVLLARERDARIGRERLSDLLGVGVRVADPLRVGDDDERGPGPAPDPLGDRLDDPGRILRGERRADLGDLRHGSRDRERLAARLAVELLARLEDRDDDGRPERQNDDRE